MADFVLDFVTDSGTVNFPKTDRFAPPAGVLPSQIMSASEWNSLGQAIVDIRKNILSGTLHGYNARYANPGLIPTIAGFQTLTSDYTYMDSNGELTLHKRDNSEWKVVTTNYLNRTGINQVFAPSGTLHVYSDGADSRYVILQQANVVSRKNTVEFLREVTNQRVFVGQSQNATDGWVPANAAIVEVNDGSTLRGVLHSPPDGTRVTFGHSSTNPQMRIGVHTTSPSKKVDIAGDLNVQQSSSLVDTYVTGTLFVTGSVRSIGQVAASGVFGYVLAGNERLQPRNNVINGSFEFWQRGTANVTISSVAAVRTFMTDRWWYFAYNFGGAGSNFEFSKQSSGLTNTGTCLRMRVATASTLFMDNWGFLIQEIDRDIVKQLRGKKCTLTWKVRKGSTWGTHYIHAGVYGGTGAETQNLNTYTGGYALFDRFLSAPTSAGVWQTYTLTFDIPVTTSTTTMAVRLACPAQHSSAAHPADANDYIEVAEVMLTAGETANNIFEFCGRDIGGELLLCQKYFEKSYDIVAATGSATGVGTHMTNTVDATITDTFTWALGKHPEFLVKKRGSPTIFLWDDAGNANQWVVGGAVRASATAWICDRGFRITNNTGGNVTPSNNYAYGHWAADSEI